MILLLKLINVLKVCYLSALYHCYNMFNYYMLCQPLLLTNYINHNRGSVFSGNLVATLTKLIQNLRSDISHLVAGGLPPSGSRRLLHLLTGLHCKYIVSSLCSFQVATEMLKQKITGYAARL